MTPMTKSPSGKIISQLGLLERMIANKISNNIQTTTALSNIVHYPNKLMLETAHMELRRLIKQWYAHKIGVRSCQILDSEAENLVKEIIDLFYGDNRKATPGRWQASISTKNTRG